MAKLSKRYYPGVEPIRAAVLEGRTEDARTLIAKTLRDGAAQAPDVDSSIDNALCALSESRFDDAKMLLKGAKSVSKTSPEVLLWAADLIKPPKRGRGRPKKSNPTRWMEIGECFDELQREGYGYDESVEMTEQRTRSSTNHVKACLKLYFGAKYPDE